MFVGGTRPISRDRGLTCYTWGTLLSWGVCGVWLPHFLAQPPLSQKQSPGDGEELLTGFHERVVLELNGTGICPVYLYLATPALTHVQLRALYFHVPAFNLLP